MPSLKNERRGRVFPRNWSLTHREELGEDERDVSQWEPHSSQAMPLFAGATQLAPQLEPHSSDDNMFPGKAVLSQLAPQLEPHSSLQRW